MSSAAPSTTLRGHHVAKGLRTLGPTVRPMEMRTALPGPKRVDPFYTSQEWRSLVATLIERRGRRCEQCGKTHEDDGTPVRIIGDHIHERKDGGADLDPMNVQLLCTRSGGNGRIHSDGRRGGCHARKTAEAAKRRLLR